MEVAGFSLSLEVILQIVLFAGTFADTGHIAVLIDVPGNSNPGLSSGGAVSARFQPSILHA